MNLCNYNKNIISLYTSRISPSHNVKISWSDYWEGIAIQFYGFAFKIPDNLVYFNAVDNPVSYQFFDVYNYGHYEVHLRIYWWRYGKE